MPSRMVWPGITLVEPPCQVSVQPPAWLPMLSALLPATYTLLFAFSGSVRCLLRSSTWLSATASRATARCALLPTWSRFDRSVSGCSKRPSSNLAVRMRDDRVVDPAHRDLAVGDQVGQRRDELVPAGGVVGRLDRLHEHVDAGQHRGLHLGAVVARELADRAPVGDDEALEVLLVLEPAGDQLLVGVHLHRVAEAVVGPVDAGEGRHDRADVVLLDRRDVRRRARAGRTPCG